MRVKAVNATTVMGDALVAGVVYECTPVEDGTLSQNAAFHALLTEWFVSGLHSYQNVKSVEDMKNAVKMDLCPWGNEYVYVDKNFNKRRTKDKDEAESLAAVDEGGNAVLWVKLKSWADYTKKERKAAIDALLSAMMQSEVNSRKFQEIVKGMEGKGA